MKHIAILAVLLLTACGPMHYEDVADLVKRCNAINGEVYYLYYEPSKQVQDVVCEVDGVRYYSGKF